MCLHFKAKSLAEELLEEAKQILNSQSTSPDEHAPSESPSAQPRIPQKLQRAKVADAMKMVDREYVLIRIPDLFFSFFFSLRDN